APRAALRGSAIRNAPAAARSAFSRAALLGSVWLGALAVFAPNAAYATDGTWIGGGAPVSNEWFQGNNWNSTPTPDTVPDITATFTNNGAPTQVTISTSTSINTIEFAPGAPAYSFTVQNGATFTITGGIINSSSFAPGFTVNTNSALTVGDGAFAEIGSLAGGGRVTIGPSDPSSLLRIVGHRASTFSPPPAPSTIRWVRFAKMRRASSPLMLRSIAARCARLLPGIVALRCVSKHEGACAGSSSSFETRARAFEVCRTPSACALLRMRPSRRAHGPSEFAERFRRARSSG